MKTAQRCFHRGLDKPVKAHAAFLGRVSFFTCVALKKRKTQKKPKQISERFQREDALFGFRRTGFKTANPRLGKDKQGVVAARRFERLGV